MARSKTRRWGILLGSGLLTAAAWYGSRHFGLEVFSQSGWPAITTLVSGGIIGYLFTGKRSEADTIIYVLRNKDKVVYIGVTFLRRSGSRIDEHRRSGKVFDRVDFGKLLPRSKALDLEARQIKKHRPKYNIQHAE